jgi:hypothetical protein
MISTAIKRDVNRLVGGDRADDPRQASLEGPARQREAGLVEA